MSADSHMLIARVRAAGKQADEGASLILVLVFVMVVGITLSALLPYTQSGVNEAVVARDVRSLQNAVDGAVQGAIDQARIDADACVGTNVLTYNAPAYPDPVQPTNAAKTVNVTVTCSDAGGGGGSNSSVPPYAIVTADGPMVVTGNAVLSVTGGIYANGNITKDPGAGAQLLVDVTGAVYTTAGHSCDADLVVASAFPPAGTPHCPADPNDPALPDTSATKYPTAMGNTVPTTIDPLGTCQSNTSIVTFQPGYYSEVPQIDPASCASNNSDVWWFSPCAGYSAGAANPCGANAPPGVYYFDFPDGSYDHYGDGQAVWDVDSEKVQLLGGSLNNGWKKDTKYSTVDGQAAGTRCDTDRTGVQFVLGGPTEISTGNNSSIELCGSATAPGAGTPGSRQRLALYGLTGAAAARTPAAQTQVVATNASDVGGFSNFTNRNDAKSIDGLSAGATFASSSATYGVRLSGYTNLPDGALITHAWLKVAHAESDSRMTPSIDVTYGSGATAKTDTCTLTPTVTNALPVDPDTIDLMNDCKFNYLKDAPLRYSFMKNMTVTYSVGASTAVTGTALLDGVELRTETVLPAVEPERPASGQAASDFVAYTNSTNTAADNTFFIGTVYTPQAPVYAVVHNQPETIFRRGVIVKSLTVNANSSSKQTDAPFQLPRSSNDRVVLFTATVAGKVQLRALVHFIDYSPADAADPDSAQFFPGRAAKVQKWTTLR